MQAEFDVWRLAAGLGLFLFGMHQLEHALTQLAGRSFKKFLADYTAQPVKGIVAGAVTTAALQSSSVVSLIVLAFVGTGVISLASALGVIFGANLGTTMTGWIVATVGFKLDIEALALPLITIGGFGVVWSSQGTRRAGLSHLVIGLGLMLMGLDFMKSGSLAATELFDPTTLAGYHAIIFLLAGLVLTAIIQSSSATIMITLSALFTGAITIEMAAAIAIGADLGTTITTLLGALGGSAAKKRVAAAAILFNLVSAIIAFLLLTPMLYFITSVIGISDPLFALVAFHSLFNLIGILIFFPFIGLLGQRLEQLFVEIEAPLLRHIKNSDTAVPEAAIENLTRETFRLIDQVAALNQASFELAPDHAFYGGADDRAGVRVFGDRPDRDRCYSDIKQLEGEILGHALALQAVPLEAEESARLSQIIPSIRNAVHSAKSIKDVSMDLLAFRESVNDRFNAYFDQFREAVREFYETLQFLRTEDVASLRFKALVEIKNKSESLHRKMQGRIYNEVARDELSDVEISTLLNVNRELYVSSHSLIFALADALLDLESASNFGSIPTAR